MKKYQLPSPNISEFMNIRDGIYGDKMFYYAICELSILDWLNSNLADNSEISENFNFKTRPVKVMMDLLLCYQLVEIKDGRYKVADEAKSFLLKNSNYSLLPYLNTISDTFDYTDTNNLMKTGAPISWPKKNAKGKSWESSMGQNDFSTEFTKGMDSRAKFYAPYLVESVDLSGHKNLLDVAGGSGIYARFFKEKYSNLNICIAEKPSVKEALENSMSLHNTSIVACDMFKDPFPNEFDVHLYSHVFHDWGKERVEFLISKSYESLPKGGVLLIHDAHFNGREKKAINVAKYSIFLMSLTKGRCYEFKELREALVNTGFVDVSYIPTIGNRSVIKAYKK